MSDKPKIYYPGDYRYSPSYRRFEQSLADSDSEAGRLGYVLDRWAKIAEYRFNELVKNVTDRLADKGFGVTFILSRDELEITTFRPNDVPLTNKQMAIRVSLAGWEHDPDQQGFTDRVIRTIESGWDPAPDPDATA